MSVAPEEFDTTPLSFVKIEIDSALARADEALTAFAANPDKYEDLIRTAVPPLHQVSGVLRMIGLEPAGRVTGAIEAMADALSRDDVAGGATVVPTAQNAIKSLSQYLDALMHGEPNRPLALFPAYRSVVAAIGSEKVSEVDLFYPDLRQSPTFLDGSPPEGVELNKFVTVKRTEYQRALLNLLRGSDYAKSLGAMGNTLSAIDNVSPAARRVFWWAAIGYLGGLAAGKAAPDVFQKQLCGRIDLQIKRQLEGVAAAPDGLMRELLLAIAYMPPTVERVKEIQELYRLTTLLPVAEAAEATRVKLFANNIKEQVEAAKDAWTGFTSNVNNKSNLEQFAKQTAQLNELARNFNNAPLQALFAKLAEVGQTLTANAREPDESLALETATALLVARDALDTYPKMEPDFERLAETVVQLVTAALAGQQQSANSAAILADISWAAREKQLFFQLGQEMLTSLSRIEEVLDTFFRDPGTRANLGEVSNLINQVQGALTIIDNRDAIRVLKAAKTLIEKFAASNTAPDPKDTELTADIFSNLGPFAQAMQQRRENANELLRPVMARCGIGEPELVLVLN